PSATTHAPVTTKSHAAAAVATVQAVTNARSSPRDHTSPETSGRVASNAVNAARARTVTTTSRNRGRDGGTPYGYQFTSKCVKHCQAVITPVGCARWNQSTGPTSGKR